MKRKHVRISLGIAAVAAIVTVALSACTGALGPGMFDSAPSEARGGSANSTVRVNVLLSVDASDAIRAELSGLGSIIGEIESINAVTLQTKTGALDAILALPYVLAANPDRERNVGPIDSVEATDFADGLSTWNLDVINVTDFGFDNRQVTETGEGVFVAVLDTGLLKTWRQYFPEQRIATEYAKSYGGGGGEKGFVSEQPNKWEHDTNSHGTHVTSTVIGYSLGTTPVNGVAPMATVIPVKVLNNNGSGWSSVVAAGITYIGDLKAGPLAGSPVVINMSLGGPELDAMEQAALDYAIAQGVIIVASAGNAGEAGMGYPGAYAPVISVAASGWIGEWLPIGNRSWWWNVDVSEASDAAEFYITDFSSREKLEQDLDVAAPGSWVVGPYQIQLGQLSYYFLGGTSMASPHVAGVVALMAEKNGSLTAAQAESILESSATLMDAGSQMVNGPSGVAELVTWGDDATGAGIVDAPAALALVPAL